MSGPGFGSALARSTGFVLAGALVVLLLIPLLGLALSASPSDVIAGAGDPMFLPALALSLETTAMSLLFTLATGTPLAWWLATNNSRFARVIEVVVELPIVIPPAVVGVALLAAFGRRGLWGPALDAMGLSVPFTTNAVMIAQIVVSSPFYIQAAANAFRKVDPDLLIVGRTLGATRTGAFLRIAVPVALPGLVVGASLCWARSLGEFGATLLFAGNMAGRTQTMPLAIFSALESDVRVAIVFSLVLAGIGAAMLLSLRLIPSTWARFSGARPGGPAR